MSSLFFFSYVPHFCSCMNILENTLAKGSRARKGDITSRLYSDQFSNNFHSTGGRIGEVLNFCASLTFYICVAYDSWKILLGHKITSLDYCSGTTMEKEIFIQMLCCFLVRWPELLVEFPPALCLAIKLWATLISFIIQPLSDLPERLQEEYRAGLSCLVLTTSGLAYFTL